MQEHYSETNGSQLAGAVTYFGFLSVFPILALAFFVVGWISKVYPGAHEDLAKALDSVLPGLVGNGAGQIQLSTFEHSASTVGIVGLFGVLYAGLGWVDSLRTALEAVFDIPRNQTPHFIVAKLLDLATLAVLGVVLIASVGVTGVVRGLSSRILGWIDLTAGASWLLWLAALALGIAANTVLFYSMFRLLGRPRALHRYQWQGALLGAIGFEALKNLSVYLLGAAKGEPAFQVFGISLILLVWINYFSRVTLYAAAWAYVPEEAQRRTAPLVEQDEHPAPADSDSARDRSRSLGSAAAFGGGVAVGIAAALGWRKVEGSPSRR